MDIGLSLLLQIQLGFVFAKVLNCGREFLLA
jgi:hypothetical protein